MAIGEGLVAAKTGFDLIKTLREVLKRETVDPHEVSNRLMELQELMLEAQAALGEAQEHERDLNAQIREFKRTADFGADFRFEEGVYWKREYPYCPNCWDADRKPIALVGPSDYSDHTVWDCPIHKSRYHLRKRGWPELD